MQKYLEKEFAGWEITNKDEINQLYGEANMVNLIMKGERLVLPSNLYIWATMNTSDQSLFPIDSAFKRRWDWKYVPIREGRDKETNAKLNWYINTGDKQYNWWSFISKVNKLIGSLTNSEDKKLGYFFCKAKDGEIDADLFVSKVIFYLWNDVFKDYGFDDKDFQDEEGKILSFDRFYEDKNGKTNVDITIVEQFLENLGVEEYYSDEREEEEDIDTEEEEKNGKNNFKYTINGSSQQYAKRILAAKLVEEYIKMNPDLSPEQVVNNWKSLGNIVSHFVETEEEFKSRTDIPRVEKIKCQDSYVYVSTNGWGGTAKMHELINAVNKQNWNLSVQEIKTL